MKNTICKSIYDSLYKMDNVKTYNYETAPYCGHHFDGHTGRFTQSSYHEGMGYKQAKIGWLTVYKNSEEKDWDFYFNVLKHPIIIRHKVVHKKPLLIECVYYEGFVGLNSGFRNRWFFGLLPFRDGKIVWHFFGFRFRKGIIHNGALGLAPNQTKLLNKYNKIHSYEID